MGNMQRLANIARRCFLLSIYLQPLHVLQFPEHFLLCLPVAEYISPE